MNESTTVFVGLDVHKDSIDIALADAPRDSDVATWAPWPVGSTR